MRLPPFLREPLVVFAALGGAFFGIYHLSTADQRVIEVSKAAQDSLADDYKVLTGKPADAAERRRLVDEYVAGEVLFREAIARGMHLTDKETKERLTDKMRFLITGSPAEPTEEQLIDFYAEHLDLYRSEPKVSFDHVFFQSAPDGAPRLLKVLNAGGQVAGDEFWMGRQMVSYGQSMLRGMFGQAFLDELEHAPKGAWIGPVTSIRGVHFVRLNGRDEPQLMDYAQVRDQVIQDWNAQQIETALAVQIKPLKQKYDIHVAR
ncbi:peptidylprolyl isomerase [Phenylobacterium sp. LjRoot219]|uniref:peptidylprolyl isomerase n=1 Tax=Phenylobacterium sp. LjRoot219 TaxID=3342283 RepID=UPI003ED12557